MFYSKRNFAALTAIIVLVGSTCTMVSCVKQTIQFGSQPENDYTRLIRIDSVEPVMSTILLDSFTTQNPSVFYWGNLRDPYLGLIRSRSYFKMDKPVTLPEIPVTAVYDSICLLVRLNGYHAGDTTRNITLQLDELDEELQFPYASNMYNTTHFPVNPVSWGSKTVRIRPSVDDSLLIRLDDARGLDLYNKLFNGALEITSTENFQQYIKGFSMASAVSDESVIYGILGASGSISLRLYYHHTIPYPESKTVEFLSINDEYAFNQLLADRSGTFLANPGNSSNGLIELKTPATGNICFQQTNMGLYPKITFPSLRNILQRDEVLRLLKAELYLRPVSGTFDDHLFPLPDSLLLVQTDGSNISGSTVYDSSGTNIQYASPVIDRVYGVNSYYRFELTNYIKSFLENSSSSDDGFFIWQNETGLKRVLWTDNTHEFHTELVLSVVTINNQ